MHPPRRLPVAMSDKVQEKLEEMVAYDIIEKVNQPTDWVSSTLVESKPSTGTEGEAKISICLDPRDLMLPLSVNTSRCLQ